MSSPPTTEADETGSKLDARSRRHVELVVCEHAHDAADARQLLEMLGLIVPEDDGF